MDDALDFLCEQACKIWVFSLKNHYETGGDTPHLCVYLESDDWENVQSEKMEGVKMEILTLGQLFRKLGTQNLKVYTRAVQLIKEYPFENQADGGHLILVSKDSDYGTIDIRRVGYEINDEEEYDEKECDEKECDEKECDEQ